MFFPYTRSTTSSERFESLQKHLPARLKNMKPLFLSAFCLMLFRLNAQDIADPTAQKPYSLVVQTGIALQWFDHQFKSFTLSAERPLNLYNHIGLQANFFFPNGDEYYYRNITGDSWEVGIFSKTFFHGRLTGRRSSVYVGPDIRFGKRNYLDYNYDGFQNTFVERAASTFTFMARVGWQFHWGPAVLEIALPFGVENENFELDEPPSGQFYYYGWAQDTKWFVAAPSLSLGIGF